MGPGRNTAEQVEDLIRSNMWSQGHRHDILGSLPGTTAWEVETYFRWLTQRSTTQILTIGFKIIKLT